MKRAKYVLYSVIGVACAGCPGEIKDPSIFENYQLPVYDAGTPAQDAGAGDAAADSGGNQRLDSGNPAGDGGEDEDEDEPEDEDEETPDAGDPADTGAEEDADVSDGSAMVSCDIQALLALKCDGAGCHGAVGFTGFDVVSPDIGTRLDGQSASVGDCGDLLYVDPENPAQSAIYVQVTDEPCGPRSMPPAGLLSADEQACVLEWLTSL